MPDNPRQNITFASNGGEAHGYLAAPQSGTGPGVIVIQEWWGLTDHVVDVVDRLAAEGFVALAPDLYGGTTTHDSGEAGTLMGALPVADAARDLSGAVDHLLAHEAVTGSSVGAVGFCMGGGFVLVLASQGGDKIGAAVSYYAVFSTNDDPDLSGITGPVLGHFGSEDDFADPERARHLEAAVRDQAGVDVTFHIHEGAGHAFFNEGDAFGTYDADLAAKTWAETLAFLRANLG
jgi:carboxymethylenebutenolidase